MPKNLVYDETRVEGLDTVLKNLNRELRGVHTRSIRAMRRATLHVKKRSQELTPVDKGLLQDSGRSGAQDLGWPIGADGWISFGDEECDYAIYVHEINKNYTVGTWKYLEIALREEKLSRRQGDLGTYVAQVQTKLERGDAEWWAKQLGTVERDTREVGAA